jgi:myo-inositol-hexaphosphate 3-phosphohydrolase
MNLDGGRSKMQTIVVVLDSKKMSNPDLDICYRLPEQIEEFTDGSIKDNGYEYLSSTELGIWLETDDAETNVERLIDFIRTNKVLDNDLSGVAEFFISEDDCADLDNCRKIYP